MTRASTCIRALIALAAIGAATLPSTAHAYWRGGVWFGVPIVPYYPPVVVAPPPVVYAAPPVVYAPPPQFAVTPPGFVAQGSAAPQGAYGPSCYAGPYVCPAYNATPIGGACSCPGNNGRVAGSVH
jgi:hypothetical protein